MKNMQMVPFRARGAFGCACAVFPLRCEKFVFGVARCCARQLWDDVWNDVG